MTIVSSILSIFGRGEKVRLTAQLNLAIGALKGIKNYPDEEESRRTEEGYPAEITYDQWAYERMIDSYREAAKQVLKLIEDLE